MIPSFTTEPSPRVAFGANRVDRLGQDVDRLVGKRARVLLVTDPGLIAAGAAGRVQRILEEAGHATTVFSDLTGEPQARQVDAAKALGYSFNTGPELEFFLFRSNDPTSPTPLPHDQGGYFDLSTDLASHVRQDMVNALESLGIEVETSHHEVAVGQPAPG